MTWNDWATCECSAPAIPTLDRVSSRRLGGRPWYVELVVAVWGTAAGAATEPAGAAEVPAGAMATTVARRAAEPSATNLAWSRFEGPWTLPIEASKPARG